MPTQHFTLDQIRADIRKLREELNAKLTELDNRLGESITEQKHSVVVPPVPSTMGYSSFSGCGCSEWGDVVKGTRFRHYCTFHDPGTNRPT